MMLLAVARPELLPLLVTRTAPVVLPECCPRRNAGSQAL
jgi:hypothetical protein